MYPGDIAKFSQIHRFPRYKSWEKQTIKVFSKIKIYHSVILLTSTDWPKSRLTEIIHCTLFLLSDFWANLYVNESFNFSNK
jgi:lysophospholipid acyltransferase (LPLAT)-like uncharacterized protein